MTRRLVDAWTFVRNLPAELHILMALCTAMGLLASPTVDSIRDIYQAYAIAGGDHWPLQGPQLAGSMHMGPVWFYLLAIPALIGDNLHVISVFVFALSGLKFYLAWHFGKQLHSSALGLAFALMLALPSWSSTQLVIWTHTSVLETAILAYLILLRGAVVHARTGTWLLLGLAYSLAIHAHPTAAPFGWLMILGLSTVRRRPGLALWLLLGFTLPFMPYVLSQAFHGFPDLSSLDRYGRTELNPGGLAEFARLAYSTVVVGPNLFYKTTLPDNFAPVFIIVHWTVVIAGLGGFLALIRRIPRPLKQLALLGLVNFVLVALFVILIRGRTPWHLAYAPSLSLAFLYAIAWTTVLQYIPKTRWILASIAVILYASVIWGAATRIENASLRFQEKVFYDVKNIRSEWGPPGLMIPARYANAHGEFLCAEPVALHGPYTAAIDLHHGLQAAFSCGSRDSIVLGGNSASHTHWAGVSRPIENALGTEPRFRIGNVGFYTPLAIGNSGKPLALAEGERYPPRPFFQAEKPEFETVALESDTPSALLISKPVGPHLDLDIHEVSCNGEPADLRVDTNYAWLYTCSAGADNTPVSWHARYIASAPGIADSVLVPFSE